MRKRNSAICSSSVLSSPRESSDYSHIRASILASRGMSSESVRLSFELNGDRGDLPIFDHCMSQQVLLWIMMLLINSAFVMTIGLRVPQVSACPYSPEQGACDFSVRGKHFQRAKAPVKRRVIYLLKVHETVTRHVVSWQLKWVCKLSHGIFKPCAKSRSSPIAQRGFSLPLPTGTRNEVYCVFPLGVARRDLTGFKAYLV